LMAIVSCFWVFSFFFVWDHNLQYFWTTE
jgi:hypothetical protein